MALHGRRSVSSTVHIVLCSTCLPKDRDFWRPCAHFFFVTFANSGRQTILHHVSLPPTRDVCSDCSLLNETHVWTDSRRANSIGMIHHVASLAIVPHDVVNVRPFTPHPVFITHCTTTQHPFVLDKLVMDCFCSRLTVCQQLLPVASGRSNDIRYHGGACQSRTPTIHWCRLAPLIQMCGRTLVV